MTPHSSNPCLFDSKICSLDQLVEEITRMRSHNTGDEYSPKVVFTNGCFDLVHLGHVTYLSQARDLGDLLVVGLNSDKSVQRLKGPERPVANQQSRAAVLASFYFVDRVVIFDDDTPLRLIEAIKPDILVKGADYTIENVVGANFVQNHGGRVELIPLVPGESTTNLVEKMKKNQH